MIIEMWGIKVFYLRIVTNGIIPIMDYLHNVKVVKRMTI